MLFFKVGIRLLTKMEAILKHYCVFHTAIVNFYEIFISLTRKYHKIKYQMPYFLTHVVTMNYPTW